MDEVSLWWLGPGPPRPGPAVRQPVIRLAFSTDGKTLIGSGFDSVSFWNVATGKEMLSVRNAALASGQFVGFSDPYYNTQAEANPGGDLLVWQEAKGVVRVTPLPRLSEVDTADTARQETERAARQGLVGQAREMAR